MLLVLTTAGIHCILVAAAKPEMLVCVDIYADFSARGNA
jgi:hypothetical protein